MDDAFSFPTVKCLIITKKYFSYIMEKITELNADSQDRINDALYDLSECLKGKK